MRAGLNFQQSNSTCRFCDTKLKHVLVDLGMSPLCQNRIHPEQLNHMEPFYPLLVHVCHKCFLVQLDEYVSPQEIYKDYAYFSSYSDSWLAHAKKYTDHMVENHGIGQDNFVVEIASNDGYLLQYFVEKGVPVLGVEPAATAAKLGTEKGVPSVVKFFGVKTAKEVEESHGKADLILGNNVLAHVPNINDFVAGMKSLLAPDGLITMEFPHLMRLMEENQFDTIYHEHFSYLSLVAVERVFDKAGLMLFDVEELPTHGGSVRIYAQHKDNTARPKTQRYLDLRQLELDQGFEKLEFYSAFTQQVIETKRKILAFLIQAKNEGKTVVGYGAPGKGNTLLNYCGIRNDFLDYTVDRNPHKQNTYLPGTHIPVLGPENIEETKPDYLFILPWNLKDEIVKQMSHIRSWGGKFVVPIPELIIID